MRTDTPQLPLSNGPAANSPQAPASSAADRTPDADFPLFTGGPPTGLQRRIGLIQPGKPYTARRILLAIAVGWLPLALLTALQSLRIADDSFTAFLSDYGVQARMLLAVPLFIVAENMVLPRLSMIGGHMRDTGLIADAHRPTFERIVATTRYLQDSVRLEIAVATLTLTIVVALLITLPAGIMPRWNWITHSDGTRGTSFAGLWHDFVSVPILMMLLLGWLWRLVVWVRFLFEVSRLPLRVVAAHPDRAGGLKFIGMAAEAFAPVAFVLSVIVAGTLANRIGNDHVSPFSFRYAMGGYLLLIVILFVGPLVLFMKRLIEAWRIGSFEYGSLARSVGLQMERKWLGHDATPDALEANDFSATTDLYSIAANVYAMYIVPLDTKNLIVLLLAAIAPFVPVLLMSVSIDTLFKTLANLLL